MKFSLYFLIAPLVLFFSENLQAQDFPKLDSSPLDISIHRNEDNTPVIRIIYSRPQKRSREIFGQLVPYGKVWRTGANEATEVDVYESLKLGDAIINPGTYSLYTIPNEKEWTFILNNDTHVWGAYQYNEKNDVARIQVHSKHAPATIESLSMAFMPTADGVSLMIGWDDRFIEVPFKKIK